MPFEGNFKYINITLLIKLYNLHEKFIFFQLKDHKTQNLNQKQLIARTKFYTDKIVNSKCIWNSPRISRTEGILVINNLFYCEQMFSRNVLVWSLDPSLRIMALESAAISYMAVLSISSRKIWVIPHWREIITTNASGSQTVGCLISQGYCRQLVPQCKVHQSAGVEVGPSGPEVFDSSWTLPCSDKIVAVIKMELY